MSTATQRMTEKWRIDERNGDIEPIIHLTLGRAQGKPLCDFAQLSVLEEFSRA